MKRIIGIVFSALVLAFAVWLVVSCAKCSCDDPIRYKSYFNVDLLEETDDHVKFKITNDMRKKDNPSIHLLVAGLVYDVKLRGGDTFQFVEKFYDLENAEFATIITNAERCYAPQEGFEHTLSLDSVKGYMAEQGVSGEIRSVKIADIQFFKIEVNDQPLDEDYPLLAIHPYDYYFNVSRTDLEGNKSAYGVTVKNLIDGAVGYEIYNVVFTVITDQGDTWAYDWSISPSVRLSEGEVLNVDMSLEHAIGMSEHAYVLGEFRGKVIGYEIVDIDFRVIRD